MNSDSGCHFTGLFYSLLKMKNNTTSKANLKKNNRNRRFHLLLQVCKKMLYELNLFSFPKEKDVALPFKKLWNLFLKKILCSNLRWNLLRSSREEGKNVEIHRETDGQRDTSHRRLHVAWMSIFILSREQWMWKIGGFTHYNYLIT